MLKPIDDSNIDDAVALLMKGFIRHTASFWREGIQRVKDSPGNRAAGIPPGLLLMSGDRAVGVLLTPARPGSGLNGDPAPVINLSSWYVEPEHRWRAPLMLRSVISKWNAVYTDLTPSAEVRTIIATMGFHPITAGERISILPIAAVANLGSSKVVRLEDVPKSAISVEDRRMLLEHRNLNCLDGVLHAGNRWYPLLFKKRKLKSFPAVTLAYAEDISSFNHNIGAIARFLLLHGRLFLISDASENRQWHGLDFSHRGIKFAKTPKHTPRASQDWVDYTGSELTIFNF